MTSKFVVFFTEIKYIHLFTSCVKAIVFINLFYVFCFCVIQRFPLFSVFYFISYVVLNEQKCSTGLNSLWEFRIQKFYFNCSTNVFRLRKVIRKSFFLYQWQDHKLFCKPHGCCCCFLFSQRRVIASDSGAANRQDTLTCLQVYFALAAQNPSTGLREERTLDVCWYISAGPKDTL